jgi:hypothetical protein
MITPPTASSGMASAIHVARRATIGPSKMLAVRHSTSGPPRETRIAGRRMPSGVSPASHLPKAIIQPVMGG